MCNMDGKELRDGALSDISESYEAVAVNRAAMQECFLEYLLEKERSDDVDCIESTILRCGVEVSSYYENDENDCVTVELMDGSTIEGSALLGCDGIHSAVRRCMMSSLPKAVKDELHFCDIVCWWGKVDIKPGTHFHKAFKATQKHEDEGPSFIWAIGDRNRPGSFMGAPTGRTFMWAFFEQSTQVPAKQSNDLTRRGGVTLDDESKGFLDSIVRNRGELIRLAVSETPASGITTVGVFDRKNLKLPYSHGRVVLLGDAAHPQSPFMAQGVNEAITDAFVCATRLSRQPVLTALRDYDSNSRRKGVNKVIKKARTYGNMSVSRNGLVCWLFSFFVTRMPLSWLWTDMIDADAPNHDFVKDLDKELGADS